MASVVAGTKLGQYEIVKHLATGGMAELLIARSRGLVGFERHVVIKRIRADHEDRVFVDMFLNEASLAALLHHHNIVQVLDIGEEEGKPYFAMEYVHGEDLRKLLFQAFNRKEAVPIEHVVAIISTIGVALHHAHEQRSPAGEPLGIVHRDVTPANIIIGYDGNVKVVDFGIAKAAMSKVITQAGMRKGKAPYMSPEQCRAAAIDRRSDVFALGIVLHETVTGRRLFKRPNEYSTMQAITSGDIPLPSTLRKDIPPALEAIVMRALDRDRETRYQTADEMVQALDAFKTTAGLRSSANGLADYMKRMFGTRPEPWTVEEAPASVSVDFDDRLSIESPKLAQEQDEEVTVNADPPKPDDTNTEVELPKAAAAAPPKKALLPKPGRALTPPPLPSVVAKVAPKTDEPAAKSEAPTVVAKIVKPADPAPSMKAEVVKAEVTKAEVTKAEVVRAEVVKAEVTKAEVVKAEVTKAEVVKAEVTKAEAEKAEVVKAEVAKTELDKAAVRAALPPIPGGTDEVATVDRAGSVTDLDVPPAPPRIPGEDNTAIVKPLPSPLITDSPRARRGSEAPPVRRPTHDAIGEAAIETAPVEKVPARSKYLIPGIGGAAVLAIVLAWFAFRGGGTGDADESDKPLQDISVPKPKVAATEPVVDEAPRTPRTWANSEKPAETANPGAATTDPPPVATDPGTATPSSPDPTPVAVEPAKQPTPVESTAKDPVATEPVAKEPVAKEPVAKEPVAKEPVAKEPVAKTPVKAEPEVIAPPKAKPTPKAKPVVVAAKPRPTKPTAKPAVKKPAVKTTKPAPTPTAKWNPNSLFPNKK